MYCNALYVSLYFFSYGKRLIPLTSVVCVIICLTPVCHKPPSLAIKSPSVSHIVAQGDTFFNYNEHSPVVHLTIPHTPSCCCINTHYRCTKSALENGSNKFTTFVKIPDETVYSEVVFFNIYNFGRKWWAWNRKCGEIGKCNNRLINSLGIWTFSNQFYPLWMMQL